MKLCLKKKKRKEGQREGLATVTMASLPFSKGNLTKPPMSPSVWTFKTPGLTHLLMHLPLDHGPVVPQVRGEGTGVLGSLSLPLSELLVADQLCLDRWFTLSSGQGQVLLRAQLGVSDRRWWAG